MPFRFSSSRNDAAASAGTPPRLRPRRVSCAGLGSTGPGRWRAASELFPPRREPRDEVEARARENLAHVGDIGAAAPGAALEREACRVSRDFQSAGDLIIRIDGA